MKTRPPITLIACASMAAMLTAGCASSSLNSARRNYHVGQYQAAAEALAETTPPKRDKALFLMERGMIRQAAGDYDGSNDDLISAYDTIDAMTAISVSQDTGSMVINDYVQDYRGTPFERTLLHAFTAKNHLMKGHWENAAVEARRIIESLKPENKKDYPEDAYSRYMAGFCLGLMGDWSNAALQYRLAQERVPGLVIDERTGLIMPAGSTFPGPGQDTRYELAAFVLIGRSPTGQELQEQRRNIAQAGFATIVVDGREVGRSYELADTVDLAFTTKQMDAIKEVAKTVSRIAIKEATAHQIEEHDPLLAALFRIIMIGILEQPDIRRWETLPRSLQVARIPLSEKPERIEVRFTTRSGAVTRTIPVEPSVHDGGTYIIVVRDSQPVL